MKRNLLAVVLISLSLILMSCSKDNEVVKEKEEPEKPTEPVKPPVDAAPVWSSDREKNLNIVYFVPSDLDTLPLYQKRLSELFIWTQNWFKAEMKRNGYGEKTFGLYKDQTGKKVKIITIRGVKPKAQYPYEGGAGAVMDEVNAHFSKYPSEKSGSHILVIIPRYQTNPIGGGPFYGMGRWCFALDTEGIDIKNMGTTNGGFTGWFGGMIHELGHGLNLPHNRQKVSEGNTLGMALMWAGNSTLGKTKTFLTAADCAVLNTNELFNIDNKTYYGNVNASIESIYAKFNHASGNLEVKGRFKSDRKVTDVLFFNDPNVNNEGVGVNKDYNSIVWTAKPISTDSFSIEMPIADLQEKTNVTYELKVKLVCENGTVKEFLYDYDFVNGVPNLLLPYTAPGWSISDFSSEETKSENGAALNAVDGNPNTYWHSRWSTNTTDYPHHLTIDFKEIKTKSGITLLHRKGLSRAIKDFEVWAKGETGDYVKMGSFTTQNIEGKQKFNFTASSSFRYLKIIALNAHDGNKFAAIGEISIY
ncbi:MAG: discoidin domain-containing protein [Chitinophagaceae bacterium]|nr:MAG: discoidin domain-containing protein [Chitinophagaceae bacterium]